MINQLERYRDAKFRQDLYTKHELGNGLSVALLDIQGTLIGTPQGVIKISSNQIYSHIVVYHGSLNEQEGEGGFAHLVEHVAWQGSNQEDSNNIKKRLTDNNAEYLLDSTLYVAGMAPDDFRDYLEFLNGQLFNPRFDDDALVKQGKQAVLNEIGDEKSKRNPYFYYYMQKYLEALLGENSPHLYFDLGNEEDINNATGDKLRNFYERGYHPNNILAIFAGELPDDALHSIDHVFGHMPRGPDSRYRFSRIPPVKERQELHLPAPDLINKERPHDSRTYVRIGMVGCS